MSDLLQCLGSHLEDQVALIASVAAADHQDLHRCYSSVHRSLIDRQWYSWSINPVQVEVVALTNVDVIAAAKSFDS